MSRDEEKSLPRHERQSMDESKELMTRSRSGLSGMLRPSILWRARSETKQLRKTAYLDGLRGFAALLVYCLHHQIWGHSGIGGEFILENAFGWNDQYYFVSLPGIRVFFSGGHTAVAVFYLISGYVLTLTPLTLLQAGELGRVAENLSSALFRRWMRLFLPVMATTFIWMSTWHLFGIRSNNPSHPAPEKNWFDEVWMWYCDFKNYSFFFHDKYFNKYNDHAWSLPLEMRGSILVWTVLLGLARCRTNMRLALQAGLIWYFLYITDGWYCAAFMTGMLLCDLELLDANNQLPAIISRLKALPHWIYYAFLTMSIYLAGVPSITEDIGRLRESPGWTFLSYLKPQAFWDFRWFFRYWAATLAMIAIPRIPALKGFFEGRFCQFLGRVSFSLYIVHGPILWSIGDRVYALVGRTHPGQLGTIPAWMDRLPLPDWGPFGFEVNFLVAQMILLPLTLWVAEMTTRLIDEPSLKFSKWLFNYTVAPKPRS